MEPVVGQGVVDLAGAPPSPSPGPAASGLSAASLAAAASVDGVLGVEHDHGSDDAHQQLSGRAFAAGGELAQAVQVFAEAFVVSRDHARAPVRRCGVPRRRALPGVGMARCVAAVAWHGGRLVVAVDSDDSVRRAGSELIARVGSRLGTRRGLGIARRLSVHSWRSCAADPALLAGRPGLSWLPVA